MSVKKSTWTDADGSVAIDSPSNNQSWLYYKVLKDLPNTPTKKIIFTYFLCDKLNCLLSRHVHSVIRCMGQ